MSAPLSLFLDVTVSLSTALFTKARRYTLVDALDTIAEMTIEVVGLDPDLDPAELLGQPASVHLAEPAVPRFDGVVRHVEQRDTGAGVASVIALTVAPWPWLTTERSGHRIFQDRTALDIVLDVLAPYGEAMERPEGVIVQHVLPVYEYRVQWGEMDHDFLFRILSEHGLCSYWSPDATGRRRWIVTDDTTAGSPDMELPFRPASSALAAAEPHVSAASVDARLCCSEVKLRDYDHRKPAFRLEQHSRAGAAIASEEALGRYSFAVGQFDDDRGGQLLAQRRLEQARGKGRAYRWETSIALRPGMKVRLYDHPRDSANGDFLVVAAWSEVDPKVSRHVAEVVPAAEPWRPAARPKPRIQGTQTAFVAGEPGKEIDVDREARILVRFPWDLREDGASRRVRVATPWMGNSRGLWMCPRVGDEVVIAYLDGDPDQPLVVGSVNNAVAPPANGLPHLGTQSWWVSRSTGDGDGQNWIVMDDMKGEELLYLRAERDFFCDTQRNTMTKVGGSASLSVVQGQSVEVGGDTKMTVKGKCELHAGNVEVHSMGNVNFNANGERNDSSEKFHFISSPFIYLNGTSEVEIKAQDKIRLMVGSSSITLENGKITLSAPLIELNP